MITSIIIIASSVVMVEKWTKRKQEVEAAGVPLVFIMLMLVGYVLGPCSALQHWGWMCQRNPVELAATGLMLMLKIFLWIYIVYPLFIQSLREGFIRKKKKFRIF